MSVREGGHRAWVRLKPPCPTGSDDDLCVEATKREGTGAPAEYEGT